MQRLELHCHTKSVSGALYKTILYHGQSAGKEIANSAVFNFRPNADSDWISLTEVGREFQARDAAAGNARSPTVARRVGGTTSVDVRQCIFLRRRPRGPMVGGVRPDQRALKQPTRRTGVFSGF